MRMTDNLTNVSKAGLDWKDFSRKEKSQGTSRGSLAGEDGPFHWAAGTNQPSLGLALESCCSRSRVLEKRTPA